MDIEKLKTFYQVAMAGNITQVANDTSMSTSSISRHIKALESSLNVILFKRNGSGFSLTNKGQLLFTKLDKLFGEFRNIETELLDREAVAGNFKIATTHALAAIWLSRFLYKFIDQYPDVRFNINAGNHELLTALQENDVAIRPFDSNAQGVEQIFLMRWRLQLFASKQYLKRFGVPKHPDDLYSHRIILFEDNTSLYPVAHTHWPLHMQSQFGRPRVPFMTVNSLQAAYQLVCSGVGIGTFVKDSALVLEGGLVPVLGELIHTEVDVYYIYPSCLKNDKLISAFALFLQEEVECSSMQREKNKNVTKNR